LFNLRIKGRNEGGQHQCRFKTEEVSSLHSLQKKHTQKNIAGGGQMQFMKITSNQGISQRSASLKIQTQNLNKLT
jgi:hypothetical protein